MIRITAYNTLTEEAKELRWNVFVTEQQFKEEYDQTDKIAVHLVMFDDNTPIACCRFFPADIPGIYSIGRFAVIKEYRKKGLGIKLLEEAERLIKEKGGKVISLAAQCQAMGFYEKQGYVPVGDIFYEEHCPHIKMKKSL